MVEATVRETAAPSLTQRDPGPVTAAPQPPVKKYQLAPRDDSCKTFTMCKQGLCATPIEYPCLDIVITGAGDFFYNTWEAAVVEDGVQVCTTSFDCLDCQGKDDVSCNGGGTLKFHINQVWYTSGKYKRTYEYILPEVKDEPFNCGEYLRTPDCDDDKTNTNGLGRHPHYPDRHTPPSLHMSPSFLLPAEWPMPIETRAGWRGC